MDKQLELRRLCDKIGKKGDRNFSANVIYNALIRGGITSVEQLMNTPMEDLLKIRQLGKKKVSYIIDKLEESE